MKHAKELVNAIKAITDIGVTVFPAQVLSVDKVNNTCEVEYNEMDLANIQLQAIIKPNVKGLLVYPAPDSWVIVQRLGDKGSFFITMVSEVEQVLLKVDDCVLDIKEGFLIKKENETLKNILDDLIDEITKIIVPTNVGPSGVPINKPKFELIKIRVDSLLK